MSTPANDAVEVPRVLVELADCAAGAAAGQGGALWRLAEPGRQLDANLVRLAPGAGVGEHVENDLDVLLVVIAGGGWIDSDEGRLPLEPQALVWLPRTSRRALAAGPGGLACLTVHRRREGLAIKGLSVAKAAVTAASVAEGGEGPCLLDQVCAACGRISPERSARYCGQCGELLHSNE